MKISDRFFFCFLPLCLTLVTLAPVAVSAANPVIHIWKPGTGNWSDATHWTGGVPNDALSDVRDDGGNKTVSSLTVDGAYTVGKMALTDPLQVANGSTLTIDGTGGFPGAGTVVGAYIDFHSIGTQTQLAINGNVTLQSSLAFDASQQPSPLNVLTGTSGSSVTLGGSVSGFRLIGNGQINIVNKSAIFGGKQTGGETVIQPLATYVQTADGGIVTALGSLRLAGSGSFTLDGVISVTNNVTSGNGGSATLSKDPSATLTNFESSTGTLHGGHYTAYGLSGPATINLNVGPILVNDAEIELIADQAAFPGLESLQANHGSLTLNSVDFSTSGAFDNAGTLVAGFATFTAAGSLTNRGVVSLNSDFGRPGTLQLNGGYTQTAGALRLGGTSNVQIDTPVRSPNGPVQIQGGRLEGGGTITGAVECGAVIAPFTNYHQFSQLRINGMLTMSAGATLEMRSGGADYFGQTTDSVVVSGAATLAGELQLRVGNLAQPPATGAGFTLLTAGALSGTFSNVASGSRLRTVDSAGSYLVTYGAGSSSPTAVTLSDFQPAPPRVIGDLPPGEPAGTVFAAFGPPTSGPFNGTLKVGTAKVAALFAGDGSVRVRAGGPAPLAGASHLKFGIPSGDAATAQLKGAAPAFTTKNDDVLLAGLTEGPVRIAAREGADLNGSPGVSVKTFGTIDGNGADIFFLATLQGTGVTVANNAALCAAFPDGTARILVRKGFPIVNAGPNVSVIGTLAGVAGSLPEGRWRTSPSALTARLTFADKSSALYVVNAGDGGAAPAFSRVVGLKDTLDAPLAGAVVSAIGLSGYPAVRLTLLAGQGGVTKADNAAILAYDEETPALLARVNAAAPGFAPTVKFKTLGEPVSGGSGSAFSATLAGVTPGASLWYAPIGEPSQLLAHAGDPAPGGGRYATLGTLVFPDGAAAGPVFTGTVAVDTRNGITPKDTARLWAADRNGNVSLILRAGGTVYLDGAARTMQSFTALVPAAGSIGAARGYDAAGHLTVLATVIDPAKPAVKIVALIDFLLP